MACGNARVAPAEVQTETDTEVEMETETEAETTSDKQQLFKKNTQNDNRISLLIDSPSLPHPGRS